MWANRRPLGERDGSVGRIDHASWSAAGFAGEGCPSVISQKRDIWPAARSTWSNGRNIRVGLHNQVAKLPLAEGLVYTILRLGSQQAIPSRPAQFPHFG